MLKPTLLKKALKRALFATTMLLMLAGTVPSIDAAPVSPARSTAVQQRRAHAAAVRARARARAARQRRKAVRKHHKRQVRRATQR